MMVNQSNHFLNKLFNPSSIVLIGVSERENSVGRLIFENLVAAGYSGELFLVNVKRDELFGRKCYRSVDQIETLPELAVVVTPAMAVLNVMNECGAKGIKKAVVISAGFAETGNAGVERQRELKQLLGKYGIRMIGPNCLGIINPLIGLNATFSKNKALPGNLALVSQSGAICTAILDWAESKKIGFSMVASMGDAADIDFGDILDFLSVDPNTKSILLYIEGIKDSRSFMNNLRRVTRIKPVIVIKSGRHELSAKAAHSHTGAIAGGDDVFNSALERAGAIRVYSFSELFNVAQALTSGRSVNNNRLTVITNAGGPGVMAVDRSVDVGVDLVPLSDELNKKLSAFLPEHWSKSNPIDILGDATENVYKNAVAAVLEEADTDGLLVMLTPQAMTDPTSCAKAVCEAAKKTKIAVFACWMGADFVEQARKIFAENNIPCYVGPEAAVTAFAQLAAYAKRKKLLLQAPKPFEIKNRPSSLGAKLIISQALKENRPYLSYMETRAVLKSFGIPTPECYLAKNESDALIYGESLGFPLVMKISSSKMLHKSDEGGVCLNIKSIEEVMSTYQELIKKFRNKFDGEEPEGIIIESMAVMPYSREVFCGIIRDKVFGPTVAFGSGGIMVEILKDRALALPPLNREIIRNRLEMTKVGKILKKFRNMPSVDTYELESVLLRVSLMACELPEITEMDINPLLVSPTGVISVDSRICVAPQAGSFQKYEHLAIHPYPDDMEEVIHTTPSTSIKLRPIKPEDADSLQEFLKHLSPQTRFLRFMENIHELTPLTLIRFTQIDYNREMAFVAINKTQSGEEIVGVSRYSALPDAQTAEFSVVVTDKLQNQGIGRALMRILLNSAKTHGMHKIVGEILTNNNNMLKFVRSIGFVTKIDKEDPSITNAEYTL